MIDKKQKIKSFLKRQGRSSTTKIAITIKSNKWMAEQYLEQMAKDKIIIKESETRGTYWSLK